MVLEDHAILLSCLIMYNHLQGLTKNELVKKRHWNSRLWENNDNAVSLIPFDSLHSGKGALPIEKRTQNKARSMHQYLSQKYTHQQEECSPYGDFE
jgi:hypothetical protein